MQHVSYIFVMQLYTCSNSTSPRISFAQHRPFLISNQLTEAKNFERITHYSTAAENCRDREAEREMGSNEDWRKNADTHKMKPEDVKAAGVEASKTPPGHHPGTVLHQRRSLPYSLTTITVAGVFVVGAIGYLTLYTLKKPEASAKDVAKVATNVAVPEDTKPRK
ncbi:uncharacterized protein LOC120085554 [Benincasa hispida]|uniref:uncharacterized protein LOC120085554 n=1 Tax=Benincasa hispida TaxID=102211 RepID=UPI00190291D4|nr:uncharacterized protein LOC120085554 [Benincasa hispida]